MQLILTHEQADFDAIASLLGAYLTNNQAIPVLPRKINRNVRAFLTLYGAELPFVDVRDIPEGAITGIILVDTQALVSIKGMPPKLPVSVIDHHPLREDYPTEWSYTLSGTGANVTLLSEILRERGVVMSPLQATLLLLGIYEDTGSLTYSHTTPRDLKAAGYLLEQGANLTILNDFLNHPLSQNQQVIFEHLQKNVENLTIHNHTVMIAWADARSVDEELSTIVHKLRDLWDPDALFVLITIQAGVQMIARSTSDDIDVAKVAIEFEGGGHERAAASLIKDRTLNDIRKDLIAKLPEFVQPGVTVGQIMSNKPHLLAPQTPVADVAELMQRYGYEGFPVVKEEKIVGLITRRAVDRAINHRLNLVAENLMEAGGHTVTADDSIETLQKVMTTSGWGQIPVVQQESGKIIGIVTRTDLFKTLTAGYRVPSRQKLTSQLEKALPPARFALLKAVAELSGQQRFALFIVGGFVRDLLLERDGTDFDIVVEGDAISLAKLLAKKYGGRVTGHTRFGTAKWHIRENQASLSQILQDQSQVRLPEWKTSDLPGMLDLVSARTEFYSHPTALPTVEPGSIKLDLHRRDFTINTMALRLDGAHYGELHDYWGGLNDLRHGIIRVLHSLSFVDDPTRILRAVRFEQRFDFRIEKRTQELIEDALPLVLRVSGDRIRHELNTILEEEKVSQILKRMAELKIMAAVHPALFWDGWLERKIEALFADQDSAEVEFSLPKESTQRRDLVYSLWMMRNQPEQVLDIINRLRLPARIGRMVREVNRVWLEIGELKTARPSQVVAKLEALSENSLLAIFLAADDEETRNKIITFTSKWRKIKPTISGDQLVAWGLKPGPDYRRLLAELKNAWLDGVVKTPEEENRFLRVSLEKTNTPI